MASSSNRKSSSSASSAPKPTYRRADGSTRAASKKSASPSKDAPEKETPAPAAKAPSTKVTAVRGLRPKQEAVPPARAAASGRPSTAAAGKRAAAAGKTAQGASAAASPAKAAAKPASSATAAAAGTGSAKTAAKTGAVKTGAVKTGAAKATATPSAAKTPASPSKRSAAPAATKPAARKAAAPKAAPAAGTVAAAGSSAATKSASPAAAAPAAKGPAARAGERRAAAKRSGPRTLTSVPAASSSKKRARGPFARLLAPAKGALSSVPRPHAGKGLLIGIAVMVLALVIAAVAWLNSGFFDIETVVVNGGENVSQATVEQLLEVPEGTTYFTVDEDAILSSLTRSAWICGVEIERQFPDTLVITPVERTVALVVYINADEVAWLVSSDGVWIAPASLSLYTDSEGNLIEASEDGTYSEDAIELSAQEAAAVVAEEYGALLLIDVPSDVSPSSGEEVEAEVILAALAYWEGFSEEFLAQIKNLSAASVEAISANLVSGIEVALGEAEDIATKELVVTTLLEEQEGVTYINVREADAYTFRSTPS